MYNNFSSKKTKKVISALLASALVVTSGPITADAATAKVVGIKKTFTVSASATNKVTGLSKAEKKVVKVTKKGKKFTIKGLKAGKATFKIGKKSYTVKVGATTVKAAKTKLTLTKGKKATLKFTTKSGNGDTLTFKASNKNVTLAKKSAKIAKSAASVKATAKKAGKTTITATSKATGKKATVTVTVKNPAKPATTTPGASNTPVATATGSATNTPEATATATATASGSATNTPDVTATPVATATGTATATPVATGSATNTPEATEVPTEAPTKAPEVVTGGTITVTTNVTGASIKVVSNGSVVAEVTNTATSTAIKGIKAGTYTVEVSKDGYVTSTKEVTVSGIDVTVNVDLEVKTLQVASVVADNGTTKATLPATDVVADSTLYVYFDGDVKSTSIVTGNIELTKNGVKQLITVTYSSAKKAAVVKLTNDVFEAGATYTLKVNSVESAEGLSMKAYTTTFTVAKNAIIQTARWNSAAYGNAASYSSPAGVDNDLDGAVVDGRADSASGSKEEIEFVFNKEMDATSVKNTANYKLYDVTDGKYLEKVVGTPATANGKTTVVITTDPLTTKHEYQLTVENITSLDGTVMAAKTYKFFFGVDVLDLTNVKANGRTCAQGTTASNVYGNLNAYSGHTGFTFQAQISDGVNATTINEDTVVLTNKTTGEVVKTTVAYEAGSRYIVVTPAQDLDEETTYEIVFDGIVASNGLKMTKKTFLFATGDFVEPTIVSVTPEAGTDNVELNKNIVITFSEGMDTSSIANKIELKNLTDKSVNNGVLNLASYYTTSWSQDKKVLTLTNTQKLAVGTTYQLTIKAGVTDDATNQNELAKDYSVKFATVGATTTYLEKVQVGTTATYDKDNKSVDTGITNVDVTNGLYFTFDKDVTSKGTPIITVSEKSNSAWVPMTVGTDYVVDKSLNSNKTILIRPETLVAGWNTANDSWSADTTYKIEISDLKDENGNDVAAQTFIFTTGTAPSYTVSNPTEFSTTTTVNQKYIYTVIEDADNNLDASTLTSSNVKVVKKDDKSVAPYTLKNAQYIKNVVSVVGITTGDTASNTGTTISTTQANAAKYNVGDLVSDGTSYAIVTAKSDTQITIDRAFSTTSAVKNHGKAVYTGAAASFQNKDSLTITSSDKGFETGKLYAFTDGSKTEYAVASVVNNTAVTLDHTIDANSAFSGPVFVYEAQGVVYELNKDAKLDANTQYQIVISGVKDTAGNEMDATSKTFTTTADTQVLKFISSSVENGDAGVPVDAKIEFTMNEEVTDVTFNAHSSKTTADGSVDCLDNIEVTDVTINKVVTNRFDITKSGTKITVEAKGLLVAGHVYKIELKSALQSATAGTFDGKTIKFQAEANASVKPKLVSAKAVDSNGDGALIAGEFIILTFDRELDQTTAETEVNYVVNGAYSLGTGLVADLQPDNKTVKITLGSSPIVLPELTTIKVNSVTTVSGVTVDDTAVTITK